MDPKDVVEIRTPEVNVEEVMERIRQRVHQRRAGAQAQGMNYDRLTDSRTTSSVTGRQLKSDFYYALNQARQSADSIWVSLSVVGDSRYPQFLASIAARVRQALHQLVIYYVNMLAGRQVNFNRSAVDVVSDLAEAHEVLLERVDTLEKEVVELRKLVAAQRQNDL